ncbi:MAG: hypothetical protein H6842_15325 [Rhodospirillaceae bacterium]|nr:hypothetical protein [Rhodospirillaceae bacterium]
MCEPTLALTVASTVASTIGTIRQASSEAAADRYNAAVLERNAVLARQQAAAEARRIRDAGARALGQQRVAFGASGVAVEGTPLDVLGDTAATIELDALTARYGGEVEAANHRARAAALRSQATATRRNALYGAGTSLLLTVGRAAHRTFGTSSASAKKPPASVPYYPGAGYLPGTGGLY